MKRSVLFFICIIGSLTAAPSTIAVNELSSKTIPENQLPILSQRLRSELFNTGKFTVMERAEMESILTEQGFQQSGTCDESSCMVEVGKLLGVQQILAGTIGSIGTDFYTLSLRIIDVQTGKIIQSSDHDFHGSIKELISRGIGESAKKIANKSTAPIRVDLPTEVESSEPKGKSTSPIHRGDLVLGASGSSTWFYGMKSEPGFLNPDMGGGVTLSAVVHPFVDWLSTGVDLGMMWSDEKHNQSWDKEQWIKKNSKTQIGFTLDFHPLAVAKSNRTEPRRTDLYFGTRFGPNYYGSTYEYITETTEEARLPDTTHSDFFVDGHIGINIMFFKHVGMKVELGSDRAQWVGAVVRIPMRENKAQ